MPTARRAQAAAACVVELGNGDMFIIDIGSGSMTNVQSLMVPAILRINQLIQTNSWCKYMPWRETKELAYGDKYDSSIIGRSTLDDCWYVNPDCMEPKAGQKATGHLRDQGET